MGISLAVMEGDSCPGPAGTHGDSLVPAGGLRQLHGAEGDPLPPRANLPWISRVDVNVPPSDAMVNPATTWLRYCGPERGRLEPIFPPALFPLKM